MITSLSDLGKSSNDNVNGKKQDKGIVIGRRYTQKKTASIYVSLKPRHHERSGEGKGDGERANNLSKSYNPRANPDANSKKQKLVISFSSRKSSLSHKVKLQILSLLGGFAVRERKIIIQG